ncbi:MAG TPA: hypothetical protein GX002_06000, partial [Clostridiales bacterium]|nr:hypothetical protein [Clostridiales bacterium]
MNSSFDNLKEINIKEDNQPIEGSVIPDDSNLPQMTTSHVSQTMQSNAILAEGNLSRLASVMRKAKSGEPIT